MNIFTFTSAAFLMFFLGDGSAGQEKAPEGAHVIVRTAVPGSGWLGVRIEDMTPRLARRMNVTTETGALVNEVIKDSPAEKAGIKEDDIIVGFRTRTIDDADELRSAVAKAEAGQSVQVTLMRRNEKKTLAVDIAKPPRSKASWRAAVPLHSPEIKLFTNRWFSGQKMHGMTLMELTKQLAAYFEVPGNRGVLVEEIEEKSAAEKAGLRAGDVVLKVGKESVSDLEDFRDAFEEAKEGDRIEVTILRKGKQSSVTLEVEETLGSVYERFGHFDIAPHLPPGDFDVDVEVPDINLEEMEEFRDQLEDARSDMESAREKLREQMQYLRQELETVRLHRST